MTKVVFVRHGESVWNKENRFTGWTDVDLSEKGMDEARKAGRILKENGFYFDVAFTSYLKRAIKTLWIMLEELDQMYVQVYTSWRLNERHYGALQGLNKSEMAAKYGEEQVHMWRRSYDVRPPELEINDPRSSYNDPRYRELSSEEIPRSESLKDTVARAVPYWNDVILPKIKEGKRVLIVAHGNSIRALIKHIENMSEQEVLNLNIPTGIPLVYELDFEYRPVSSYYLGDPEEIRKAIEKVKSQGKAEQN